MMTGSEGTFVISWSQTEVDGWKAAPKSAIGVGASWCWRGEPVRLDRARQVLRLENPVGEADMRARVSRKVHKVLGRAFSEQAEAAADHAPPLDEPLLRQGFDVTDGHRVFRATLIETGPERAPLVMFDGELPPPHSDLWVVRSEMASAKDSRRRDPAAGVICFTPGTRIRTDRGDVAIEEICEGDRVQTKDNGLQEVVWKGQKHLSGARLFAMPELRPIRLRAGALGIDRPDDDLTVSPSHRMLVRGATARALFNTDEVLVAARDLVDDHRIRRDLTLPQVTYVHLLLPRHEIVFANGLETESFHPYAAALENVEPSERARLMQAMPGVSAGPAAYGDTARRVLSRAEAAILTAPRTTARPRLALM